MTDLLSLAQYAAAAFDLYGSLPGPLRAALHLLVLGAGIMWLLWVFYLAVMNLKRVNDAGQLGRMAYLLGLPVLILGYLLDFLANVLVMTILLAELPQETTVTARLKRHKRSSKGWRLKVATWFASELLDRFDPDGVHV